jgi:hypothetical protein
VERITAEEEENEDMDQDVPSFVPGMCETRDVFQAVEPDTTRETHARRLSEKTAVKGQRLLRPEREGHHRHHHGQTETDVVRPVRQKRVAKLAPIKMLREVYLPRLVTIGNLAKILNVRLGKCTTRLQSFSADQPAQLLYNEHY